jgi:ATP phosphoribosyltransferase
MQLGEKFFQEKGLKHVQLSTADGALEAAPAMGTADAILDLVSSGTTLRENNLKEINGGAVLSSQGVFVANKRALLERKEVLDVAHELLERFEAHLTAHGQFTVVANMRGSSAEEVAERILEHTDFSGLQGPTISPVYTTKTGNICVDYYAIVICVPKPKLYHAVRQLRKAGGSGVLVSPLTYIFDEETPRYRNLLAALKS